MKVKAIISSILVLFTDTAFAQDQNYRNVDEAVKIYVEPIPLNKNDMEQIVVGQLSYRGGLHLYADDKRFGGLSSLGISADGRRLNSFSDRGMWFSASLIYDKSGKLIGIKNTNLGPLIGPDGRSLASRIVGDAESMASGPGGEILVSFERRHRILRYRSDTIIPELIPGPRKMLELPFNRGIEALTVLTDGTLLALSEGNYGNKIVVGWIKRDKEWSALAYQIGGGGFRVTGATTLPNGDILVLERLFTQQGKNAIRLKRVGASSIFDGPVIEGQLVAELTLPLNIDNFEGFTSRSESDGGVIIYLISDDNFSRQQRTLLMVFEIKRNRGKLR